ncbi:rhodopsin-like orphan GPCR [Clonorchis sinensis]|uniref:Rhodopsin-like orphan GPCR n=1 Tax=Clonorchis sinensis TaxID=79923 RepID=H2KPV1_CLOSI|nr:rhodopsin-like orphan GPCR [Clonorchis sinensis]
MQFDDTPRELREVCEKGLHGKYGVDEQLCALLSTIGWSTAYILPVICGFGLIGTTFVIIAVVHRSKGFARQLIYLLCMLITSVVINILISWLWLIPSKGIPYASNGTVYFFIRYTTASMCTAHYATSILTVALYSNVLLVASLDRFMTIFFPTKTITLTNRHAMIAVGIAVCFSCVTVLPPTLEVTWVPVDDIIFCGFPEDRLASITAHLLFSLLMQPILIGIFNVLLYYRLTVLCKKHSPDDKHSNSHRQLRASLTLFLLSLAYLAFSMPLAISTIVTVVLIRRDGQLDDGVHVAQGVVFLMWEIFFLRELANIVIIVRQVPLVRSFMLRIIQKNSRKSQDSVSFATKNSGQKK